MEISERLLRGIAKFLFTNIDTIKDEGTKDTVSVSSTCLSEVEYDLATQILTVTFAESGSRYNYLGVTESDYEGLVQALSVGEEYNDSIKYDYPYVRIG
jgi:hypothetical protein